MKTSEWHFHKIPPAHYKTAWQWEIERQATGVGLPWLDLSKNHKQCLLDYTAQTLYPLTPIQLDQRGSELMEMMATGEIYAGTQTSAHLFEIDWAVGNKRELLRAFERWIDSNPAGKNPLAWKSNKGGAPRKFDAMLFNLAAFRLSESGLTRSMAIQKLKPLINWQGIPTKNIESNKLSASHWENAQAEIRLAIAAHSNRRFYLRMIIT